MPQTGQGRWPPLTGSVLLHLLFFVAIGLSATRCSRTPPQIPLAIEGSLVAYTPSTQRASPSTVREVERPVPVVVQRATLQEQSAKPPQASEPPPRSDAGPASRPPPPPATEKAQRIVNPNTSPGTTSAPRGTVSPPPSPAFSAQRALPEPARAHADRQAELQRALAAEESAAAAAARAGATDAYRVLLVQTIERNWIRPPSVGPGIECALNVTQAPGGTVVDVKLGVCNADAAVRESIINAVYRSSPLPAPADPDAFERRLIIVFSPRE